jgi:fido (protein-threonine AMPylation protein)
MSATVRHKKTGPPPETATGSAVRWHHRLVSIHSFRNGNGRWSRLAAADKGEMGPLVAFAQS